MGHWRGISRLDVRALIILGAFFAVGGAQRPCNERDFTFKYTECDENGQRWRVAVPKNASITTQCSGGVPFPQRGKNCTFTCNAGQYLDMDSQKCSRCAAGTYSLGGGVRFNDFDALPAGFQSRSQPTAAASAEPCPADGGWTVRNDVIVYIPTPCWATLSYSVRLTRPGHVEFVYRQREDSTYFTVDVQNDQCQSMRDSLAQLRFADQRKGSSRRGSWQTERIELQSGQNVISWTVSGSSLLLNTGPIYISRIDVTGMAYTTKCTSCPAGTSSGPEAGTCIPCTPNSYSSKGSNTCSPCSAQQYSGSRATACKDRPACQERDSYQAHSTCDANNKVDVKHEWVQPHICRDDVPGAVRLPPTHAIDCPKCNAGMQNDKKTGRCEFCAKDSFSDGVTACQKCPPNTVPNRGLRVAWWYNMPEFMKAECEMLYDDMSDACEGVDSWLPGGASVHTAHTQRRGVVLELTLNLAAGLRNPLLVGEPSPQNPVGHLSFVFEVKCVDSNCALYFFEQSVQNPYNLIASFNGSTSKQVYVHPITHASPTQFTWAFLRGGSTGDYLSDEASIYVMNVTNTASGGAIDCAPCPIQRGGAKGCVPCPAGHYIDEKSHVCTKCPTNTMLNTSSDRLGADSCIACGPNLKSENGSKCTTDGKFTLQVKAGKTVETRRYDLSKLGERTFEVAGVRVFGYEGSSYYHMFNVSLFGAKTATCRETYRVPNEMRNSHMVETAVCRVTALPVSRNASTHILYVSPLSVGSRLLGVTAERELGGIRLTDEDLDIAGKSEEPLDVHLFLASDAEPTGSCPDGQAVVVTARCDPLHERTEARLPRACPDGTCDGCRFHVLLSSPHACPLCADADYQTITGECVDGRQTIHRIPSKHCVMSGQRQREHTQECVVFEQEVQLLAALAGAVSVLLCCLVVVVWKRNRKLEYKYMKLVEAKGGKEGELPAAESCALDEDEEDEDDVVYSKAKTSRVPRFASIDEEKRPLDFESSRA